jgi:spoIIIJ-associated protein
MIKSIETTGSTEDEAIAAALRQLGLTRDDVSVEVLERGKKGFLGIGNVPAKVRVSYEVPEVKETVVTVTAVVSNVSDDSDKISQVKTFLTGLFERMGVEADISATENEEDGSISVELSGSNVGALIGRRGETLDAIQHLSNYVINSGEGERTRINVDAENYRAKRTEALENLAKKVAGKVVKYHRNVTLEPMNAYERHVIHTALQDYEGVTTYSTGTEPNRRVVVACERGGSYSHRSSSSYSQRSQGDRTQRRAPRPTPVQPATQATSEEPEAPKHTTREWH